MLPTPPYTHTHTYTQRERFFTACREEERKKAEEDKATAE
jgi:hypothetical protein